MVLFADAFEKGYKCNVKSSSFVNTFVTKAPPVIIQEKMNQTKKALITGMAEHIETQSVISVYDNG
jgi:hypothetical protein